MEPAKTAFVACSKAKRSQPCKARDLYLGTLFKKSFAYASANYPNVYILSALHGVVHPDTVLEPYDQTLNQMSAKERQAWYEMVREQMTQLQLPRPFVFFTGRLYNQAFDGYKPLEGLPIGKQLQWFTQRLRRPGFF